jgi:hypothetical protein
VFALISHLFDFTESWMYVTFIGILGSMQRRDVGALQPSKDFLNTFGGLRKIQP